MPLFVSPEAMLVKVDPLFVEYKSSTVAVVVSLTDQVILVEVPPLFIELARPGPLAITGAAVSKTTLADVEAVAILPAASLLQR